MKLWGFFQLKQSVKEYRLCCLINYILSVGRNEQTSECIKKNTGEGIGADYRSLSTSRSFALLRSLIASTRVRWVQEQHLVNTQCLQCSFSDTYPTTNWFRKLLSIWLLRCFSLSDLHFMGATYNILLKIHHLQHLVKGTLFFFYDSFFFFLLYKCEIINTTVIT